MKKYVVELPSFDVEAESYQDACEQVYQTLMDYPSSHNYRVREFGSDNEININPNELEV